MSELIAPYGQMLVDLMVPHEERSTLHSYASQLPSIQVSTRTECDLELLATGAFSPLDGFMGSADYACVLETMRLTNGFLFPIPITLPVPSLHGITLDADVALRDARNDILAVLTVQEVYCWSLDEEACAVYGTLDTRHPLVAEMHGWGRYNIAGRLRVLRLPRHYDFIELRLTPTQTRQRLARLGRSNVVAFQTRNPMHRVHEELTKRACEAVDGSLLLHPAVGMTKPGDVDHFTRVRSYRALVRHYYDRRRVLLALLPLAMRMAGPREALWHALIRRSYGANHLIMGRDHAGPGLDSQGVPFYGPYDAQELVCRHAEELGVAVIPFGSLVYLPDEDRYEEADKVPDGTRTAEISGTQVREQYLDTGRLLPEWFTRPEVADILAEAYPPRHRQGVCIWFTGLSGSGKSTTAAVLTVRLQERGRQVTVLDGDVVRTHLSRGLGFSREDRDINIRRIGYVASEIVRHGGVAVCAAISPYRSTRNDVRNMVGPEHFVEVYADTPLEVCERRDAKGLYARARRGEIRGFTGIDDPYEPPTEPDIVLNTVAHSPYENAARIIDLLAQRGFVEGEAIAVPLPDMVASHMTDEGESRADSDAIGI
ncbi:MAG TPA: bifunctional sulfate adenylyltransferase/adenylylsulfate kinase [Chloroflexi bacterium]|jgi:sulfate adenylyltransferase|nr:bifunctional sulfate adenylyltransferase/adenylylsulfate kinase [Chloroflexota bacterium]